MRSALVQTDPVYSNIRHSGIEMESRTLLWRDRITKRIAANFPRASATVANGNIGYFVD